MEMKKSDERQVTFATPDVTYKVRKNRTLQNTGSSDEENTRQGFYDKPSSELKAMENL